MPYTKYAQMQNAYYAVHHPYHTSAYSSPTSVHHDHHQVDYLDLRVQLRNKLNTGELRNMPVGFPFHYVFDGHSGRISHESFEFREDFWLSSFEEQTHPQSVIFSYSSPTVSSRSYGKMSGSSYHTWRISLPTRSSLPKPPIAYVQVEPSVMKSSYGSVIMSDSRIILRALAISVELGIQITIQLANTEALTPPMRPKKHSSYQSNSIVYIGTYNDGRREILYTV